MTTTKTLAFENGDRMPMLGLGTWKSEPGEVGAAVEAALQIGYRHVDCAPIYGNEPEIGRALGEAIGGGVVAREDLWITSKLWNNRHAPEDVRPALEKTLADLRLDFLDLYLVHWPVALRRDVLIPESAEDFVSLDEVPIAETWRAMESLVDAGICRHIGVSNFGVTRLDALRAEARIPPAANQIELHPYLQQPQILEYGKKHGVHLTAYSPLGSGDRPDRLRGSNERILLEDPTVAAIARRHEATPAQVLLAWALQRGLAVIPKSVRPDRMRENLDAADLELTGQDMEELTALDRGRRYIDGTFWVHEGGPYTLEGLWA